MGISAVSNTNVSVFLFLFQEGIQEDSVVAKVCAVVTSGRFGCSARWPTGSGGSVRTLNGGTHRPRSIATDAHAKLEIH